MSERLSITSEPLVGSLSVNGELLKADDLRELRQRLDAGELDAIEFDAVTFRAVYPNANFYRFRDGDLSALASSFSGQPFLRNHDTRDIGSRDGTVDKGGLSGNDFVQRVRLTTARGMRSFVEGQIDRFSIGWYFDGVTCSVCNEDWFGCGHWPGRSYVVEGSDAEVCEIIFENPSGKETSAVNTPAVQGTGILSELCDLKERLSKERMMSEEVKKVEVEEVVVPDAGLGAPAGDPSGWGAYLREQAINAALVGSGLPGRAQSVVRMALEGREVGPSDVDAAIEAQRSVLAEAEEKSVVRGVDPLDAQADSLEKMAAAIDGLISGKRPTGLGVRPLSGIREAYIALSGDYEMMGKFVPENVGLANVTSSTMAGLVANALNKVVVNTFQSLPKEFLEICSEEDFNTLQDVDWITLGGVGELPTVSEGGAYTEMTWDDQTETDAFVKKGGYLGLTLEAIDKDNTRRLRQAGPALGQSAWLTLLKSFSAIFTSNSGVGPTMSDSKALFHADHSNLGTTALSYAEWEAARTAMRKQTELNSGERLGALVVPKYLLVPPDLEGTALTVLLSEGQPGTSNNDENPWAEGEGRDARLAAAKRRVIVMDLWTDTNNWAAAADPLLYPSIGLGYRFGRTPEIFSVADENSGLMFSNDVMPIKVRWFYAIGPTDWRGLYKENVA